MLRCLWFRSLMGKTGVLLNFIDFFSGLEKSRLKHWSPEGSPGMPFFGRLPGEKSSLDSIVDANTVRAPSQELVGLGGGLKQQPI